jgi:hypothetical protein
LAAPKAGAMGERLMPASLLDPCRDTACTPVEKRSYFLVGRLFDLTESPSPSQVAQIVLLGNCGVRFIVKTLARKDLGPINPGVEQPPPVHLFTKLFRILLYAFTGKTILTTRPHILFDLPTDVLIERQQALVFRL